jgi:hypothetical protein
MTSTDIQQIPAQNSIRRVILASFIGTTIEWYDFFCMERQRPWFLTVFSFRT